ncbi:MAG: ATP-binding cassette domain-containing protein, partial [Microbacteriaceae bacterium]|nr:ATP-binding cassette domain-containing protein [Microbacteriaceae bacterium]
AMVFQNYALYPHMSVEDNMGFGLKTRGVPKAERAERVREAAGLLDLENLLHRHPAELSGGQRQRVAMGRAIVREPQVFLMDEPLSNLDAKLRVQTRAQIASLQRRLGTTTVYVTHDQTEAMTMGDRIAVLDEGRLQQLGSPQELYRRPANEFVARFIGTPAMSVWTTRLVDGALPLGEGALPLDPAVAAAIGDREVRVGVRPEDLRLAGDDEPGAPLDIDLVEELGSDAYLHGTARLGGSEAAIVARVDGREHPHQGDAVRVVPEPGRLHWFEAEGDGARIPGTDPA